MFRAISFTFFASGYVAFIQVVTLALSARYLTPEQLGWASIGGIVLAFSNIFIDSGFGTFIIYKRDLLRAELNALLILGFILALIAYFLILLLSNEIELFFNSKGLGEVLTLYAILLLFSPLMSQLQSLLILEQRLESLALAEILSKTLGLFVAISLLYYGYGIKALIASLLFSTFIKMWMMHYYLPKKLKIKFSSFNFTIIPLAWDYCKYQIGGQLLNFARVYVDSLVVGKVFDVSQLGIYSLAKDLIGKIPAVLNPVYAKIIFPVMTRIKGQVELRNELFKGVNIIIIYINVLVYSSVAVFSDIIVSVLYTNNELVSNIIKLLCIFYMIRGCGIINGFYLQSIGEVKREFYWNVFASLTFPIVVYFSAFQGLSFMVMSMVLIQVFYLVVSYIYFHYPKFPLGIINYLRISFSLLFLGVITVVSMYIFHGDNSFIIMICLYIIMLLLLTLMSFLFLGRMGNIVKLKKIYTN